MQLFWVKVGSIVLIALASLVSSFMPMCLMSCIFRGRKTSNRWFSYLLSFSGALIASTGVNHVLMNSIDAFDTYKEGLAYPWAPCICTLFIFLSWFLDALFAKRQESLQLYENIGLIDDADDPPPVEPFVFTAALYIHSVLEGLVVGAASLQKATVTVYVVMGALVLHKSLEGFALGNMLEQQGYKVGWRILLLLLFSGLTPLGIGIGLVITEAITGRPGILAAAIITAVSSGVFLYVGIVAILPREVQKLDRVRLRKFAFMGGGWLASSVIAYLVVL